MIENEPKLDDVSFRLIVSAKGSTILRDGITFSNCAFTEVSINGEVLSSQAYFNDCSVVYDELRKSTERDGDYLIFTCTCGIADCGGWDYVRVKHESGTVTWKMDVGDKTFTYVFDKEEYVEGVKNIGREIDRLEGDIVLLPENVVFPE